MADPEPESVRIWSASVPYSSAGEGLGSAEISALGPSARYETEDWPPASFAENDHILVWWLPEYDDAIRQLVDEFQWVWRSAVFARLEELVPEAVLRAWRDADPLCREWSWYNVLDTFTAARAKQIGVSPRPARRVSCACCAGEFLESHLSYASVKRVGIDGIDACEKCMSQAFFSTGSPTSTPEAVTAVLQTLREALGRPPKASDLSGRLDLRGLSREARVPVIQALRVKPTTSRVKERFGSWAAAVASAEATPRLPLPAYAPLTPALPAADTEFTSIDPARYQSAIGPLPEVTLDAGRAPLEYAGEAESLIGTGYLALAEAALAKIRDEPYPSYLLAQVYCQTARLDEAREVVRRTYGDDQEGLSGELFQPRDLRTIARSPVFYEPLSTPPRGNVRFVLIGGPMEYVDRRGEHACVTGDPPEGGSAAEAAESVARMNAMVDGGPWLEAALRTGLAIMNSLARTAGGDAPPYGHTVSYVTSTLRSIVKSLTGSLPKKVAADAWRIGPVGKSGWSYQNDARPYVFNASSGFTYMTVDAAPAVCVWAWPDRSDLCLQAFLDTIAGQAPDPVTVILPDVPALRDFARRYACGERMGKTERALMEEHLYRMPGAAVTKRGYVISAEFAPRLVVHVGGAEDDGAALISAAAFLSAHHTLRLSVWDAMGDGLLREAAGAAPATVRPYHVAASERADMVHWYAQVPEYDDPGVLLRPCRPSLLDAVLSS